MQLVLLWALLAQAPAGGAPPGHSLVTGRVLDAATHKPVAAAMVALRTAQSTPNQADRVLTDDDGRYFFDGLPTGNYSLTVTKPGWLPGAFGRRRPDGPSQTLALAESDRRPDIDLLLWKRAALAGVAVDDAGEPVVGVTVRAVRRVIVAGRARAEVARSARTDDRGEFRLYNLTPGDYSVLLVATVSSGHTTFDFPPPPEFLQTMTTLGAAPFEFARESGVPSGDGTHVLTLPAGVTAGQAADGAWLVVPPTFLGSSTSAGMTFVSVGSGQVREGLTLQVRRVRSTTVAGTLTAPDGMVANHVLHLLPADSADYPLFDVAQAVTDAAGAFTFYGVPAGNYVLRVVRVPAPKTPDTSLTVAYTNDPTHRFVSASGRSQPAVNVDPLMFASQQVVVGDTPIRGLTIAMQPGARVAGRAEFDGTAPRPSPADMNAMRIDVELANGYVPYQWVTAGRYAADGTFQTPSQVPGAYFIRPSVVHGWSVKSITAGGRDVTERPVDLTSDVLDVIVTYTDRPQTISGTVSKAGATDPGASVVVFPTDRDLWAPDGANSRRLMLARADAAGGFTMTAPPPGDYFAIALADDDLGAWREPAMLARLAAAAQRVSVRDGEPLRLTLTTQAVR